MNLEEGRLRREHERKLRELKRRKNQDLEKIKKEAEEDE